MIFQDLWAFLSESVSWLSLNEAVDEISCFVAPILWDFSFSDFDLLWQNVVSDLFPVLTVIWPLAEHALVGYDSHSEVVHCYTVVLTAHNLGCHVAWCSRRVLWILWIPQASDAQVGDSEIAMLVKDQILRLDVSMKNCILMEVFKAKEHTRDKEL